MLKGLICRFFEHELVQIDPTNEDSEFWCRRCGKIAPISYFQKFDNHFVDGNVQIKTPSKGTTIIQRQTGNNNIQIAGNINIKGNLNGKD